MTGLTERYKYPFFIALCKDTVIDLLPRDKASEVKEGTITNSILNSS